MSKTRRGLSPYAIGTLKRLRSGEIARLEINNGCVDRLLTDGLVEIVMLQSPYNIDFGKPRPHVKITQAGRERAKE